MPLNHTEIVLIRHGQTDWNVLGKYQGSTDIALNAVGLNQAKATQQAIVELHQEGAFAALYSSDLQRAQQTATPLAHALSLPLHIEPRLRERNYGMLEGLTREQIALQYPQHAANLHAPHHAIPKGETPAQFYDRVHTALSDLAARHTGQRVAAVCHGGTLAMAWRVATQTWVDVQRAGPILNASINSITHDGTRFHVRLWGEVEHLRHISDNLAA
jgi:2,3-bisphosphoglycerate-dependent phosphoglycerate mutase